MYLALEALLLARVAAALPTWQVRGTLDYVPDLAADDAPEYLCRISYAGATVEAQQQTKAKLAQRWQVDLYVREAQTHDSRITVVDAALDALIVALLGWQPGPGMLEMRLAEAPFDAQDGIARFGLAFDSQVVMGS
jgi:hypothetical protein